MAIPYTDKEMLEMGYTNWRELLDGTILAVGPMMFNNGRLFVDINSSGYAYCYCYDSLELAEKSMLDFNPEVDKEPQGWKRDPYTGRRRENGDPTKEIVRA
jgi:hypothetical protein